MIHIILLPLGGAVTVTCYWHVEVSRVEIKQCGVISAFIVTACSQWPQGGFKAGL